jgi:hypothetical protein
LIPKTYKGLEIIVLKGVCMSTNYSLSDAKENLKNVKLTSSQIANCIINSSGSIENKIIRLLGHVKRTQESSTFIEKLISTELNLHHETKSLRSPLIDKYGKKYYIRNGLIDTYGRYQLNQIKKNSDVDYYIILKYNVFSEKLSIYLVPNSSIIALYGDIGKCYSHKESKSKTIPLSCSAKNRGNISYSKHNYYINKYAISSIDELKEKIIY